MACEKPIVIKYVMLANHFARNAVKAAQIIGWWFEDITRIDPTPPNSDFPHAYISVVN